MLLWSRKKEEVFKNDVKPIKKVESRDRHLEKYQVIIIAGGLGQRLKHRTGKLPKPLLKVGQKTLIEYCIERYSSAGLKDFVFLISDYAKAIKDFVKDGSELGIRASYFVEKKLLGKGGSIKEALKHGVIDPRRPAIITYPDDLILIDNFAERLLRRHEVGVKKGYVMTIVRVPRVRHEYGVVEVDEEGAVVSFEEKPYLKVPSNIGTYAVEPRFFDFVEELVDVENGKSDLESVVIKEIVSRGLAFSMTIQLEAWIPVNDEKG